MATYRYAALVCRDPLGGFSAFVLDNKVVAFDTSVNSVKRQLRNYFEERLREYGNSVYSDFREPTLTWHKIVVRPEYRNEERIYPSNTRVKMKVACVTGQRSSGQLTAALPMLNVRFDYTDAKELNDLVQRYGLQKLEDMTPEQLSRCLPPTSCQIIEFAIKEPKKKGFIEETIPPTIKQVAEALGDRAMRQGFSRAWEREDDVKKLVHKLQHEKANILIVGESGVGKTTVLIDAVKDVEKLINESNTYNTKTKRKYWLTSASRIVAGMKYLGQWEERAESLIEELGEIQGVLCVDQLLNMIQRGGVGPTDSIAAFLQPYLARAELRMVAEVTPSELDACRRLLPGFVELFQVVRIESFDRVKALAVIDKRLETSASGSKIDVALGTGEQIVRLYRRFMPYTVFPGAASIFARDLINYAHRNSLKTVNPELVVQRFQTQTGLPELFLRDEITLSRPEVLNWFRKRVIDQPESCEVATDIVMTMKSGLNDPQRPLSVALFCGPTGVGKTHMALALADYFFGNGNELSQSQGLSGRRPGEAKRMIRFDMSEYAGYDAVYRLLGSPNGEPGELIRKVREQPFCVLLLDEIEKASPEVFDALMGVFDEGRLTDNFGRVANFRSAIIIMTSNLGANSGSSVGFNSGNQLGNQNSNQTSAYRSAVMNYFRPEFFNRLDAVVTFDPLRQETIRTIAQRELDSIVLRDGLKDRNLKIIWDEELVTHLANVGFDPKYGARPLHRAVEREVVASFAKWLILQEKQPIGTIHAKWRDGEIAWSINRNSY